MSEMLAADRDGRDEPGGARRGGEGGGKVDAAGLSSSSLNPLSRSSPRLQGRQERRERLAGPALRQPKQESPSHQQQRPRLRNESEKKQEEDGGATVGEDSAHMSSGADTLDAENSVLISRPSLVSPRPAAGHGASVAGAPPAGDDRQVLHRTNHDPHSSEHYTGSESDVNSGDADEDQRAENAAARHRTVLCPSSPLNAASLAPRGQAEPDENLLSRSPENGCVLKQRAQQALKTQGTSQKQIGPFSRSPRTPAAWRADFLATAAPSGEARRIHVAAQRLSALTPAVQEHQVHRERHVSIDSICQRRSADLEEAALDDENLRAKLDELGDVLDHDAAMLGENLDKWIGMMRRAVMADFLDSKTLIMRRHGRLLADAREEYHASTDEVNQELERTSQRLLAAEVTIGNRGITILRCADKLRNKQAMLMASGLFSRWRVAYTHRQFENFCRRLSGRHYRHSLLRKAMYAWKSDVGNTWRKLAERKMRAAAEKQIQTLAIEYEKKIAKLSGQLHQATTIIRESQTARANYEDTMKKAFLRGVCALNMEAMSVFNGNRRGVPSDSSEHAPDSSAAAKSTASREADPPKVDLAGLEPKTFADGPLDFAETERATGAENKLSIASFNARSGLRTEDRWDPHGLPCPQPSPQEVRKLYSHTSAARRPHSLGIGSPSGSTRPRQAPTNGAAIRLRSHGVAGREEPHGEPARIARPVTSAVTVTRHVKPPNPGTPPFRAGVDPPVTTLQRG